VSTSPDDLGRDRITVVDDRSDRSVEVSLDECARLLDAVLAGEGLPARAGASVTVVDAAHIADLAATHLGHAGPTDVLSFPIDGRGPVDEPEPWFVGDVVVCPEVAAAQAPGHAGDLAAELALLVVHGGLHLCGWDHATPGDEAAMWARERELLDELGVELSADPWGDRSGEATTPEVTA